MNNLPIVIKLGGAVLSDDKALTSLFTSVKQLQSHRPVVILHGGGYLVDELMEKLQFEVVKKDGLRVTPFEQIPVITGALAGTANKMLQSQAIKNNLISVGLCLADGGLCQVSAFDPELGAVGLAKAGNSDLLLSILKTEVLPIISSIGITDEGQLMNINADQAAVAVASALNADLILLSDVCGVLDANGQLMENLTRQESEQLIRDKVITDGMIVKVNAAFDAAKMLGRPIRIMSWKNPEKLLSLLKNESLGTQFLP